MTRAASVLAFFLPAIASVSSGPAPTFTKDVAPILFKNCVSCHRPGEIAQDISLISYEAAKPWADSIKKTVMKREMPPWPADSSSSVPFRNDPRLTQRDIKTLIAWVEAGAPKGNDSDLPELPPLTQGWLHPNGHAPDMVITLPKFKIPGTGEVPYIRHMVKVPFSEDKWIAAMQVRPGNRAVVHHMAITELELAEGVTPADLDKLATIAQQLGLPNQSVATHPAVADPSNAAVFDMLGVYTPGTTFEMCEDGSAKLLKGGKNFYLNFNIHYQTLGQPQEDQSMLGIWFRPEAPKHQLFRVPASGETLIVEGKELLADAPGEKAEGTGVAIPPIPPYAENYEVVGITAYTRPVTIYQLQPHAHLRGKNFKYSVVYPEGQEKILLNVPKYNFHWQLAYELKTPLKLPAGAKLVVTAHYDNSQKNVRLLHHGMHAVSDPEHTFGPEKEVFFREQNQSWDEMFSPFVQYTIDNQSFQDSGSPAGQEAAGQPVDKIPGQALDVVEVVGCLEQGSGTNWTLSKASKPIVSASPGTSSVELKKAGSIPLAHQKYQLLGANIFDPSRHRDQKLAVKGVLITDGKQYRLNVTSLQTVSPACQ
jgi:hypothetical protein